MQGQRNLPLAVLLATLVGSGAGATVIRDTTSAKAANPAVESGGHRLYPSGPMRVACSQFGSPVMNAHNVTQLATGSWTLMGGLSFQRSGQDGRSLVLPLGDGATTCIVSPDR